MNAPLDLRLSDLARTADALAKVSAAVGYEFSTEHHDMFVDANRLLSEASAILHKASVELHDAQFSVSPDGTLAVPRINYHALLSEEEIKNIEHFGLR